MLLLVIISFLVQFFPYKIPPPFERTTVNILIDVPFTPQAPFANWKDPRQQDGCEEASALMAIKWARRESLTRKDALEEILKINTSPDTSAFDTAELILKNHFGYQQTEIKYDVSIDDLVKELAKGKIIIAPMNGQALNNPHFTQPGPERHMVLIRGYDGRKKEFITNDPGIAQGEGYRYPEEVFYQAIRDYPSGYHVPITMVEKNVIVVSFQYL